MIPTGSLGASHGRARLLLFRFLLPLLPLLLPGASGPEFVRQFRRLRSQRRLVRSEGSIGRGGRSGSRLASPASSTPAGRSCAAGASSRPRRCIQPLGIRDGFLSPGSALTPRRRPLARAQEADAAGPPGLVPAVSALGDFLARVTPSCHPPRRFSPNGLCHASLEDGPGCLPRGRRQEVLA